MIRAWKVVVLLNLALIVGVGWGWVRWGRTNARLQAELTDARAAAASVERQWQVQGVVRAVLPEVGLIVLTHDEIPGFMTPMTMGFRLASPQVADSVTVGEAVQFTLRGTPPNVVVTAIKPASP